MWILYTEAMVFEDRHYQAKTTANLSLEEHRTLSFVMIGHRLLEQAAVMVRTLSILVICDPYEVCSN